jgi:hypothetical protein
MDLERYIRESLESVPVPEALTNRIHAAVLRRRITHYGALAVAAAVLIVAVVFSFQSEPTQPKIAFAVSLAERAPEPMWLQEIRFIADLDADGDRVVFHLGGPTDD